jgi:3-methyladenine DNA glycosylase AlkC
VGIKAETTFALKDQLFNPQTLAQLVAGISRAYPKFKASRFRSAVLARFDELELKARIMWIVDCLAAELPADHAVARDILLRALPQPLDPKRADDDFGQFIWVVPGEFVAKHGCDEANLAASLDFLREATKRFSSEGAIRPFLQAFPNATMAFVHECALDDNYHVRRLASEGIRPYLPWATRVLLPLAEIIAVLEPLHADSTRYVTRSVANTLNDLAKIQPDLVVRTLRRWRKAKQQEANELNWLTRHSLRTLLKENHGGALALLGYPLDPKFRISKIATTATVKIGDYFSWSCELASLANQKLKVYLRVWFLKANGEHSAKMFAVTDAQFTQGQRTTIAKRLAFKPMTTRALYPGRHFAELVVNGVTRKRYSFELVA